MITSGNYEQGTGAKRALMLGFMVLICTPMVVSLLLLLAVEWPKMDGVTVHLPRGVRATVASGILSGFDYGRNKAKQDRAKRLDAETAAGYRPPEVLVGLKPADMSEMYRKQRESKKAAGDLLRRAAELEKSGKECDAEDLYTQAASKDPSSEVYEYTEGMGRAGLKCGDLPGARAGLEAAVLKEKNFIEGTDEDQLGKVRQDMLADQLFLIVVYDREHETALAKQTCSDAHKDWVGCACVLGKDGDVKCTEKR